MPRQAHAAAQFGALILDTRQDTDRWSDGLIRGAIHVPRTVLEWRVDPAARQQNPRITGFDQTLVIMCNEGYSSSLAAHTLQRLGFANATDMIGGFAAWRLDGLPTESPADQRLVEHRVMTPEQAEQIQAEQIQPVQTQPVQTQPVQTQSVQIPDGAGR